MTAKGDLKDYAWVLRGKQRRKVVGALHGHKIPTQIKEESGLSLNNVSDVLRLLEKKKLAKCLNPEEKTGRIYELTQKGKVIRDKLVSGTKTDNSSYS